MNREPFLDLDELIREVRQRIEEQEWKRDNPYVVDLIEALAPHPEGLERLHVIRDVGRLRRKKNLPMPKRLEETVQSAFQGYSSQSAAFRGGADLFHWPRGKGTGIWAVHLERAKAWLRKKGK